MQTFSPILTKVNTVPLAFRDRINLVQVQDEHLMKFVQHCHNALTADVVAEGNCIRVYTSKGWYIYSCLSGKYFQRVDGAKLTKKWYAIS